MNRTSLRSVACFGAFVAIALIAFAAISRASASGASTTVVTSASCLGDVNGDGIVKGTDVALVARRLGARAGTPRYDARYDLNSDGRINLRDLAIVVSRLGTVCDQTPVPTNTPPPATATRTSTPSATATYTWTPTATATFTATATNTPTATPTDTPSPTPTDTPSPTATYTPTGTATATATSTATDVPASETPTATATATEAPTATVTSTATATPGNGLPPDPAHVAPPVDQTLATDIFSATAFLYSGSDPIQTGVVPGTIELRRVAVLRGRVLDRADQALSGVAISVLDHPEFGQTLSRADGTFDLAVNGGGQIVLRYEKLGFLPSQRTVDSPWREFAWAPDVVLVPFDTASTVIDAASTSMQVARGSLVTDTDGTRQATVLFPAGTTAQAVLPDGSTRQLSTLTFRATEYTIGDTGPEAMPATLPETSVYTYAVEFSVDEAVATGAAAVRFNQPLPAYVENFLSFPVGSAVPAGYYDRERGEWVASANGRVIKVLSIGGGVAEVDAGGDGLADSAAALAALGVTLDERSRLATLYTPGTTLWRVPVAHFTPWDFNWPKGPPTDAVPPPPPVQQLNIPQLSDPCIQFGSVIGCENQTLGESAPVIGTPWMLHYTSGRTPGRSDARVVDVVVSGPDPVPASLRRIRVEVEIAGRRFEQTFAPAPNLVYSLTWDGKDAYGRQLLGQRRASIDLHYDYEPQVYTVRSEFESSFGRPGFTFGPVNPSGRRGSAFITSTRSWTDDIVGGWDARAAGLGGWSLTDHHAYDPGAGLLLLGDGRQRGAQSIASIITTAAGTGGSDRSGEGGQATASSLQDAIGMAVAPDGSFYFADGDRIRRVAPNGIITRVAGADAYANITGGFSGDGGPATSALLNAPTDVALGPDGSLYILDLLNNRVRRVAPNGIITTVAGNGVMNFSGDGGPATAASINEPEGIEVGPDGTLYIADFRNYRVRRVGTDGIITTFAGTLITIPGCCQQQPPFVEGGPATQSGIVPRDVAVGPDGSVFIVGATPDGIERVLRVTVDGLMTTVAGGGSYSPPAYGDGGPATAAFLNHAESIAVAPDGGLFIVSHRSRVRHVGTNGVITTVAGDPTVTFATGYTGDGRPAVGASLSSPASVDVAPDGSLLIADRGNYRVRRVASAAPAISVSDVLLPSRDGRELYVFTNDGRHLRTIDALTGATTLTFGYDGDGYLTSITDGSGNVTSIERSGANATAIVAPGGQRTTLDVNGLGWLAHISNPAGETHTMTYSPDGLLQTFATPLNNTSTFGYDPLGRLTSDDAPDGGRTTLVRAELPKGYQVTTTSALGDTQTYRVEALPSGALRRTVISPAGATTEGLINPDASESRTYPDGVQIQSNFGPDPRFGMLAAILTKRVRTAPGGQIETLTGQRVATLADPANLLSLQTLTETMTVNDTRTFTRHYDATTRTFTETSAEGRAVVTEVNPLGRIASQIPAPGIASIVFTYDGQGRLVEERQGSLALTYGYDALNRVITRTDAANHVTGFGYDAADRVTTLTLPSGRAYQYGYDANGNPTSVTMPDGQTHSLGYTPSDLETSYTPPGNGSYVRTRNADRELTDWTLPGGRTTTQTYDALDRVAAQSYPEGSAQFSYALGDLTDRVSRIANTSSSSAPAQDLAFTYNGSLITAMTATGASPAQVTYSYNNSFQPTSLNLTSGADSVSTTLTWDRDGIATGFGPFTYTRNGPGGATSAAGDGSSSTTYGHDANARLASRSLAVASQARYAVQLSHDASGRLTGKTETVGGVSHGYVYTYDLDGQLTNVTRGGVTVEHYAYDGNGNRTSRQLGATPAEVASYDPQDRLTQLGAVTYQFNADGFLEQRGADTFQYNTRGQLTSATVGGQAITYAYDGLGRRVSRTDGSGTYRYIYGDPASHIVTATRDASGAFTFYYYDTDGLLIALRRGGAMYYVATDQTGTPRIVTDATGAVVKTVESDSFGVVVADTNPAFDVPIGYAGGLTDAATGLVHFGYRDYEPASGRWTTRDPIGFAGGQGNLYAYVGNSPVQHRDPMGLFCISATGYNGVGGGVSLCITDEGASVCGEVGFGVGVSVGVDVGGGLEKTGTAIVAEASFKTLGGLVEVGAGVSLDSTGCLTATPKGQLGPVTFEPGKAGLDGDSDFKPPKSFENGVEAKVAAKGCVQGKW